VLVNANPLDTPGAVLLASLLVIVLAALGLLITRVLARHTLRFVRSTESLDGERRQQMVTLVNASRWLAGVMIVFSALLMLLSNFVDIAPLLAGAGVAGLAISLGAQTLIKDLINGLLILLENQYAVGDVIRVGDASGAVEKMTLRTTHVRDLNGRLHIIPNGEVRVVSNLTKEWSRAVIDVGVAYEQDLDHVLQILETIAAQFAQDPAFQQDLQEKPQVMGPISLGDWAITMRVMAKTAPGKHWATARELQERILATFDRERIVMPYPRQEVIVKSP
jgi:small conductance mechanosensitive channel